MFVVAMPFQIEFWGCQRYFTMFSLSYVETTSRLEFNTIVMLVQNIYFHFSCLKDKNENSTVLITEMFSVLTRFQLKFKILTATCSNQRTLKIVCPCFKPTSPWELKSVAYLYKESIFFSLDKTDKNRFSEKIILDVTI